MASGSSPSGRVNCGGSKGFDFGSDDVLCSYEDYANHDSSNGNHAETMIGINSNKGFRGTRMARPSGHPSAVYNQQEDSFVQSVMSAVEKSMKKNADNLMNFLEGLSSRLSQLELYCYNIDKSIGEMRHELSRDNGDADAKLNSLEKRIHEVHRSVQIVRDKQELAETQKELAKLQLVQKESTSSSRRQSYEERSSSPASNYMKIENTSEVHDQQLALALPQQVAPQKQPLALLPPPAQAPRQNQQSYYLPPTQHTQTPHPQSHYTPDPQYRKPQPQDTAGVATPPTHSQSRYIPGSQFHTPQLQDTARMAPPPTQSQSPYIPDPRYHTPQLQETARVAPPPTHSQINQTQPSPYQQQWPQQSTQQAPQVPAMTKQPSVQTQMRPPPTAVYSPYPSNQPASTPHPDTHTSSMPMSMPYPGVPQPGSSRVDSMPYGYTGTGRPVPQGQIPPQQIKGNLGGQQGGGYVNTGSRYAFPPSSTYMTYDNEATRMHPSQPPHYRDGYPPANAPLPNMPATAGSGLMLRDQNPSQFIRSHPYSELIDKLVSMGFRADHIASVIQRMEEEGQHIDFNSVLDRLNGHSIRGQQRGW